MNWRAISLGLLLLTLAAPASAELPVPAMAGRVSFVSGQLAVRSPGQGEWAAAAVNYPAATGDSFFTDTQARAELRIGPQTIALSENTEIDLSRIDDKVMQIAIGQGRIEVNLRALPQGNTVEIDIPRGAVRLLQPGIYDIDSGPADGPSRIAVFAGGAQFAGGSLDMTIKAGDVAVISGSGQTMTATVERASPDAFASWCRSRDYDEKKLASAYYVSPWLTGYEELDQYGAWRSVPQYGTVWFPNTVAAGWVPYRDGAWAWIAPWGWTWIDAQPWGFAVSHYGRWAYIDGTWGWVPGAFVPEPVYAPALVAFIDNPALVAASAAGPMVGWFPLAPGEPFLPWYTSDLRYLQQVNYGTVSDPARLAHGGAGAAALIGANRQATTVVPQQAFARGARVAEAAVPVAAQHAQQIRAAAHPPAIRLQAARPAGFAAAALARGAGRLGGPGTAAAQAGRGHFAGPAAIHEMPRFAHPAAARIGSIHQRMPQVARMRPAHIAAPRRAAPHFAAPRMAPRFAGGPHGVPHFAAMPRGGGGGGGPHFAGAPHFAAMPRGGGPHLGGGGPPHGGAPLGAGGGGPHGGGPHGGGGGHGKGH